MQFEKIIGLIRDGLTGDAEHDLSYLKEQMEKYRKHESAREILRECGRMMYELLPDSAKEELISAMEKDDAGVEEQLGRFEFLMYRKDFDAALEVIEPLVRKMDTLVSAGIFQDDNASEYYCFNELFEEIMHHERTQSEKTFRRSPIPFAKIYSYYGALLIDLKRYEEAEEMLEKALRWNPSSADYLFELAETWKLRGDMDRFLKLTIRAFDNSFKPTMVARCFRNLGYYFTEMKYWNMAVACIVLSFEFVPADKNGQSELYYIEHMAGQHVEMPEFDEFRKVADQYGFPTGPCEELVQLAGDYANYYLFHENRDMAAYFLRIYYGLTGDEKVKETIEKIEAERQQ